MTELLSPLQTTSAIFQDEFTKLRTENNILKADLSYWKKQHERATERENQLKKELQDKNARIAYLTRQLYERKTEQQKAKTETNKTIQAAEHRSRGQQPDRPTPKRRNYENLETKDELCDLSEVEKFCATCGLPLIEMPDTEDSELIETLE